MRKFYYFKLVFPHTANVPKEHSENNISLFHKKNIRIFFAEQIKSDTFALANEQCGRINDSATSDSIHTLLLGEMVEWSITTVLKTVVPRGTGGSNPSLSAKQRQEKKS